MESSNLGPILNKAKELEKNYEWLQAVNCYQKASDIALKANCFVNVAECQKKMGFCFFRAAFQADTNKTFRIRIKLAVRAYEKAVEFFWKVEEKGKRAKINSVKALILYTRYWLAKTPSKMKKLFDDWWKSELEVLKAYEETGDLLGIGITSTNMAEGYLGLAVSSISDWLLLEKKIEEGIYYGEKAIKALSEVGDKYELARAYSWTSFNYAIAVWFRVLKNSREEYGQKSIRYSKKALKLSKMTKDAYLIAHSSLSACLREWGYSLNPITALKYSKDALKYGKIARDSLLISMANVWIVFNNDHVVNLKNDPDEQKEGFKKSIKYAQNGINYARIFAGYPYLNFAYCPYIWTHYWLASIESNLKTKHILLENAVKSARESIKDTVQWINTYPSPFIHEELLTFTIVLYGLSKLEVKVDKKRLLLEEASKYAKMLVKISQRVAPFAYWNNGGAENTRALIQAALAEIEPNPEKKRKLLENAILIMENCFALVAKDLEDITPGWKIHFIGRYYYLFGAILEQLHLLTNDKKILKRSIKAYINAAESYSKAKLITREAEACWQEAKLHDLLENFLEASHNYKSASKLFKIAGEKTPQLLEFYQKHSAYMQAWSEIEQAKHNHSRENYLQAEIHYENAGRLHEQLDNWNYLSSNYFAWAEMEQAEEFSRTEKSTEAIKSFREAIDYFQITYRNTKTKIIQNLTNEEKNLIKRILEASELRNKYCQARILMEEAKLLEREGKYLQSSKDYGKAAQMISANVEGVDVESERKELKYLAVLCRAWEKMTTAEELTSSESYLKASELFEKAKEYCYTRKASLWALGNSSFCKGLAAGVRYQLTADVSEHARAKSLMKTAATNYLQAGFDNASEYAKASQRLLDAYLYMNNAETETDQEKRAKQYQMAENVLQVAAGLFMKAEQPEKMAQVKKIVSNVREEKALAISLSQVMKAPLIASTTQSFRAPTPTSEVSVGLEKFEHANVQANLITGLKEVKVGESFCITVEIVNAGKEPALLTRIEGFVPRDFLVVKKPEIYRLEESCLNMKGKQIAPLKLVEAKLVLQPSKKGVYQLKPVVHYLDELGQNKSLQLKSVEIRVEEVILSDRVSTGTKELDSLLLGGIPKEYAVVLTGSPSDERELIVRNFLEVGVKEGQPSFCVATEADNLENLLNKTNFYLFLCNPKPKIEVPDLPNVTKLRSKTDINNLNMALARESRDFQKAGTPKRLCIELVSDVLLRQGPEVTRRWFSELITDLTSKSFVMLAVLDPSMHPTDQANAVINLFDGEISLSQTEDPLECKKSVQVKKLRGQDYIKNPICLKRQT